jgi:hypothetical protein
VFCVGDCFLIANPARLHLAPAQCVFIAADDESKIVFETSDGIDVVGSFDSMGLREDLLRGIYGKPILSAQRVFLLMSGTFCSLRLREAVCHPAARYHPHR